MVKIKSFIYESVYTFLERTLNSHASNDQIMEAKKSFWRMRNSAYQLWKRQQKQTIHLNLEKAEVQLLKQRAQQAGVSVYNYIKACCHAPTTSVQTTRIYRDLEVISLELIQSS